jgi:hypothetical protein
MNQTYGMPECFAIQRFARELFSESAGGTFPGILKWAQEARLSWPDQFTRVLYMKHHRGQFLRANLYLAGAVESNPWIEKWGRDVAAAMASAVTREGGSIAMPVFKSTHPAGPSNPTPTIGQSPRTAPVTVTAEVRLRELKSLQDKGLITDEEYRMKRKAILGDQ